MSTAAAGSRLAAPQPMDDRDFIAWFDLSRPGMDEARRLSDAGSHHAAALAAAAAASGGVAPGVIPGGEIAAIRSAIARHAPGSVEHERRVAELWLAPRLPAEGELPYVDDRRLGHYARVGRVRGNETLTLALLFATTGERRYADAAIAAGLAAAARLDPTGGSPTNSWHPGAPAGGDHDVELQLQYWMAAWPLIDTAMTPEQRLSWMKAILPAARSRLIANRDEIAFNLSLHPTLSALLVAVAFPALRDAAGWIDEIAARLTTTYAGAPFATADGYTREGTAYHDVNTRLLAWAHLALARGIGRRLPALATACAGAFAMQALFVCPDGSGWMVGDGNRLSLHEPWVDAHESLHLGAALFDRPEWKALAGSVATTDPTLLDLWLMGADGIARWAAWPRVDVARRDVADAHAPASCFHALRAGRGLDAHAGLLCFGSEMNHAHHDKGQVLLYGLGRHLLSDHGHPGYGPSDMVPGYSARIHGVAAVIRRTPMGPRTDHADYTASLAQLKTEHISVALGEHRYYENHVVQRALALVSPWGAADPGRDAFWLIWDSVTWKRGWPGTAPESHELIDTIFPFHAPGCAAVVCDGGRSIVSRYDGPDGAPFTPGGPTRAQLRAAHELSDSDANLQVTRLDTPGSAATWDAVVQSGSTNTTGGPFVERPMGLFRWRGRLAHHAAYVLVPFRGVRGDVFAPVAGEADDDGLIARVTLPSGVVTVSVGGMRNHALVAAVSR
ncbi:MAG TPA: hypothetical protein VEL07_11730 [Planctomycetota bacterium]|nr:hypothetical protein [Planctomycetota bacterium]